MKIVGLNSRALDYIDNNSQFVNGQSIGCKKSSGIIKVKAILYKVEKIGTTSVFLFEYTLQGGYKCYNKIQKVVDDYIFISLKLDTGKDIKWTNKEINQYLSNIKGKQ